MAEEKISFNISSFFKGEGFTKAANATTTLSKNTSKAIGAVSGLTANLGVVDGAVGKWAGSVANLIPMLTSWAGAVSLLGVEAAALGRKFMELREAWKEEAEAAKGNIGGVDQMIGAHRRLLRSIEATKNAERDREAAFKLEHAKNQLAAIDEVAKAYKALAAAESSVSGAQGQLAIAKITEEFNAKLRKAANEMESGVIEAEKKLALAQLQGAAAVEKASAAADDARDTLHTWDQKIAAQQKIIDALTMAEQDSTDAEMALENLKEQRAIQEKKVQAADLLLEAERIKAADAEAEQRKSLEDLKRTNEEVKDQRQKAAELELAMAEEMRNAKEHATNQWNQQQRQIEATETRASTALEGQKRTARGMAADQQYHRGISGNGYTYSVDANGNADNFIDWQRANRYAGRAERDAVSQGHRNDSAAKQYERLSKAQARGDKLSDRDKQFLSDYGSFQDQQKTKSDWEKAIEDLKGAQSKTLSDLNEQLEGIKEKFEKMGLK